MNIPYDVIRQFPRPGESCYLLLDGASEPGLLNRIYEKEKTPQVFPLFEQTLFAELSDLSPLLVKVDPLGRFFIDYLYRGITHHWGLVLSSDLPFEQLVLHAQWWLTVNHPQGGEMLFRASDPRIIWRLLAASTPEQHEYWLGPFASVECPMLDNTFDDAISITSHGTLKLMDDCWLSVTNPNPTYDVHRYKQLQTFTIKQITAMEVPTHVRAYQQLYEYVAQYYPDLLYNKLLVSAIYQFMCQFNNHMRTLVPDDQVLNKQPFPLVYALTALAKGLHCQSANELYLVVNIVALLGEKLFVGRHYLAVYQLMTEADARPLEARLKEAYVLAKQYRAQ
ncbi:DUF4123 domain-containing protein [Zooshikella harenae]|uniref:DUF4123 domain-containing protein n=1 Tax=Zooshikella harenae TaxID=2827238 RepID=A0ABS5ZIL9_9GAMM|nr:DUF4123 domain-containing protein [Zooshikella harenae]MBU2713916.1 DUF4123 domain-containing protein [Zooshikella harenae]